MHRVLIGIGSNLGEREENCSAAIELMEREGIHVLSRSSFYETEPWGVKDQPRFLNMALSASTDCAPRELLRRLKGIEQIMGRKEGIRWGPRIIDLDILLYDHIVLNEPALVIPHPRMHEREFVLKPLLEIAPDAVHPVLKKTVREIVDEQFRNAD
jgi:2-amino-4-hydroxy-6-hydroxymethyldihydropteridine diphosphokinase